MTYVVRTAYIPATDTAGSRIMVRDNSGGKRRQRSYSFDYAATDPHMSAVAEYARECLGIECPNVSHTDARNYGRGYVFTVSATITESE